MIQSIFIYIECQKQKEIISIFAIVIASYAIANNCKSSYNITKLTVAIRK